MNKTMGFYDFLSLPKEEQLALIWKYGIHVESVVDQRTGYVLYGIYGFYVELTMSEGGEKVIGIKAFRSAAPLGKYLNCIDWRKLFGGLTLVRTKRYSYLSLIIRQLFKLESVTGFSEILFRDAL